MTIEEIWAQVSEFLKTVATNNWSILIGIVIALFATKILKAGLEIVLGIAVVVGGICLLTNLGILPPLDELWALAKQLFNSAIEALTQAAPQA